MLEFKYCLVYLFYYQIHSNFIVYLEYDLKFGKIQRGGKVSQNLNVFDKLEIRFDHFKVR